MLSQTNFSRFLSAEIDEQNCFGFLQLADHLRLSRLRERSLKYALENFEKVIQGEEYLQLPVRLVVSFLKDNRLVAKREEQVYNAAVKWLEFSGSKNVFQKYFLSPKNEFIVMKKN